MKKYWPLMAIGCLAVAAAFLIVLRYARWTDAFLKPQAYQVPTYEDRSRQTLFEEFQPVRVINCEIKRFGEPHDGGYMLCANLLGDVKSGYSYGISGYDGWGCDVSTLLHIPVHQYDCFNLTVPVCSGGNTVFHGECVAGERSVDENGRVFDSIQNQTVANQDADKHLVMKIDVEGAEWDSLLKTPDSLFERIDQMSIEFHGVGEDRFVLTAWRLKKFFFVATRHFNNFSCDDKIAPFPAWAFEVLLVNKRIGVLDPTGGVAGINPLDAPNNPTAGDCQSIAH